VTASEPRQWRRGSVRLRGLARVLRAARLTSRYTTGWARIPQTHVHALSARAQVAARSRRRARHARQRTKTLESVEV
jgi:hypothetical protein